MKQTTQANLQIPQSAQQIITRNDLPSTCETEKRIKINKYKKIFFEKFVNQSSIDQQILPHLNQKITSKNKLQKFQITDQCFTDELKFIAVCELILEINKAYIKKQPKIQPQENIKLDENEMNLNIESSQILRDNIKILSIQNCSIISNKLNYILQCFRGAQKLKSFQLISNKNQVKQSTFQEISELLASLQNIQSFHLENVSIGSELQIHQMFEKFVLNQLPPKLKQLGLIDLNLKLEIEQQNSKLKIQKQKSIQDQHGLQIYLSNKMCRLQTLFLNGNQIGVEGAVQLAQGLCQNKSIKILDLSRNVLMSRGVTLISEALSGNLMIKSIDLSYNSICNPGAASVSQLLPKSKILELRIQGNRISQEGMICIFQALTIQEKKLKKLSKQKQSVCCLKILDLSKNIMQIGAIHSLRQFLEINSEVCALSLSGFEKFHEKAFSDICSSLKKNKAIQTLDMGQVLTFNQHKSLLSVNSDREQMEKIYFIEPATILQRDEGQDDIENMMQQNQQISSTYLTAPVIQAYDNQLQEIQEDNQDQIQQQIVKENAKNYQKKFSLNDLFINDNSPGKSSQQVKKLKNVNDQKYFQQRSKSRQQITSTTFNTEKYGNTISNQTLYNDRNIVNIKTPQDQLNIQKHVIQSLASHNSSNELQSMLHNETSQKANHESLIIQNSSPKQEIKSQKKKFKKIETFFPKSDLQSTEQRSRFSPPSIKNKEASNSFNSSSANQKSGKYKSSIKDTKQKIISTQDFQQDQKSQITSQLSKSSKRIVKSPMLQFKNIRKIQNQQSQRNQNLIQDKMDTFGQNSLEIIIFDQQATSESRKLNRIVQNNEKSQNSHRIVSSKLSNDNSGSLKQKVVSQRKQSHIQPQKSLGKLSEKRKQDNIQSCRNSRQNSKKMLKKCSVRKFSKNTEQASLKEENFSQERLKSYLTSLKGFNSKFNNTYQEKNHEQLNGTQNVNLQKMMNKELHHHIHGYVNTSPSHSGKHTKNGLDIDMNQYMFGNNVDLMSDPFIAENNQMSNSPHRKDFIIGNQSIRSRSKTTQRSQSQSPGKLSNKSPAKSNLKQTFSKQSSKISSKSKSQSIQQSVSPNRKRVWFNDENVNKQTFEDTGGFGQRQQAQTSENGHDHYLYNIQDPSIEQRKRKQFNSSSLSSSDKYQRAHKSSDKNFENKRESQQPVDYTFTSSSSTYSMRESKLSDYNLNKNLKKIKDNIRAQLNHPKTQKQIQIQENFISVNKIRMSNSSEDSSSQSISQKKAKFSNRQQPDKSNMKILKERFKEFQDFKDIYKHKKIDLHHIKEQNERQISSRERFQNRVNHQQLSKNNSMKKEDRASANQSIQSTLISKQSTYNKPSWLQNHMSSINSQLTTFTLSPGQKKLLKEQMLGGQKNYNYDQQNIIDIKNQQQKLINQKKEKAIQKLQMYKQMYREIKQI